MITKALYIIKTNTTIGDKMECPTLEEMTEWLKSGYCYATDGCKVEPDGTCPHGCQSWLLELDLI